MSNRFTSSIFGLAAILAFSPAALSYAGQRGAGASAAAPSPPHDPKDLSGIWTKTWRTLALSAEVPPMTPEGQAKFNANKPSYGPRAIPPALGNDPTGKCDPLGLVRNLLLEVAIYPMEMVQTPRRVLQFFEWAHSWREIWTDGRETPSSWTRPVLTKERGLIILVLRIATRCACKNATNAWTATTWS